jgi:hypothetical protein
MAPGFRKTEFFCAGLMYKIKAPSHSLLGGFQPKPYHNVSEESPTDTLT